jgi:hypothetical protein
MKVEVVGVRTGHPETELGEGAILLNGFRGRTQATAAEGPFREMPTRIREIAGIFDRIRTKWEAPVVIATTASRKLVRQTLVPVDTAKLPWGVIVAGKPNAEMGPLQGDLDMLRRLAAANTRAEPDPDGEMAERKLDASLRKHLVSVQVTPRDKYGDLDSTRATTFDYDEQYGSEGKKETFTLSRGSEKIVVVVSPDGTEVNMERNSGYKANPPYKGRVIIGEELARKWRDRKIINRMEQDEGGRSPVAVYEAAGSRRTG